MPKIRIMENRYVLRKGKAENDIKRLHIASSQEEAEKLLKKYPLACEWLHKGDIVCPFFDCDIKDIPIDTKKRMVKDLEEEYSIIVRDRIKSVLSIVNYRATGQYILPENINVIIGTRKPRKVDD